MSGPRKVGGRLERLTRWFIINVEAMFEVEVDDETWAKERVNFQFLWSNRNIYVTMRWLVKLVGNPAVIYRR